MVKNYTSRFAFTMIELIFAIVIIAISVISLPMMVQINSKGVENSILQEAVFAASAELMGATSYYWDENSMQDEAFSSLSRVIDINGDCNNDRLRNGHIYQPLHRRCLDSNTTAPADVAGVGGAVQDLNDAASIVTGTPAIFDFGGGAASGYKDAYTSDLNITRIGYIKHIESSVYNTDTPAKLIVKLKAQSANIGEIDYYKRRF